MSKKNEKGTREAGHRCVQCSWVTSASRPAFDLYFFSSKASFPCVRCSLSCVQIKLDYWERRAAKGKKKKKGAWRWRCAPARWRRRRCPAGRGSGVGRRTQNWGGLRGAPSLGPWRPDGVRGVGCECEYRGAGLRWGIPERRGPGGLPLRFLAAGRGRVTAPTGWGSAATRSSPLPRGFQAGGASVFGVQILAGAFQLCF